MNAHHVIRNNKITINTQFMHTVEYYNSITQVNPANHEQSLRQRPVSSTLAKQHTVDFTWHSMLPIPFLTLSLFLIFICLVIHHWIKKNINNSVLPH